MIKRRRAISRAGVFAILSALVLMVGCSVLPKAEPEIVYVLPEQNVVSRAAVTPSGPRWSLRVLTPYSSRMVNSTRILVIPDGSEISVYKGVRWADPAPIIVRNRLVNAFRGQAPIEAVSNDSSHFVADLELGGDLNRFHVVYADGAPIVDIQLDAFLINPSDLHIIATQRFSVQQPVNGKEVPEVVQAFGAASDKLATDLVAWALKFGPREVKER